MIRCVNCSSSTHEVEDCTVDTKNRAPADLIRDALRAAHPEDKK